MRAQTQRPASELPSVLSGLWGGAHIEHCTGRQATRQARTQPPSRPSQRRRSSAAYGPYSVSTLKTQKTGGSGDMDLGWHLVCAFSKRAPALSLLRARARSPGRHSLEHIRYARGFLPCGYLLPTGSLAEQRSTLQLYGNGAWGHFTNDNAAASRPRRRVCQTPVQ